MNFGKNMKTPSSHRKRVNRTKAIEALFKNEISIEASEQVRENFVATVPLGSREARQHRIVV